MRASNTDTLLERDRDLARIEALLEDARAGAGEALALQGGAGVGKTRLLAEAAERASGTGFRVLHAHGGELEREFPFGVVRQLFEAPLQAASDRERSRLLAGAAGLAGSLLGQGPAGESPTGGASGVSSPLAAMHGLYWLTANFASEEPLLLVIDDAQWADAASLRWLV
jgi:predicted ATPase